MRTNHKPIILIGGMVFVLVVLIALPMRCDANGASSKNDPTAESFESLFADALKLEGEEYLKVRKEIVAMGDEVVPLLQEKRNCDQWQTKMLAEILLQLITNRKEYENFSKAFEILVERKYYYHNPVARVIIAPIVGLENKEAIPFLMERLWKDRPSTGYHSIFVTERRYNMQGELIPEDIKKEPQRPATAILVRNVSVGGLAGIGTEELVKSLLYFLKKETNRHAISAISDAIVHLGTAKSLGTIKAAYDEEQSTQIKESLSIIIGWIESKAGKKSSNNEK